MYTKNTPYSLNTLASASFTTPRGGQCTPRPRMFLTIVIVAIVDVYRFPLVVPSFQHSSISDDHIKTRMRMVGATKLVNGNAMVTKHTMQAVEQNILISLLYRYSFCQYPTITDLALTEFKIIHFSHQKVECRSESWIIA